MADCVKNDIGEVREDKKKGTPFQRLKERELSVTFKQ